jgi:long-chain acyl-CoA synthetase
VLPLATAAGGGRIDDFEAQQLIAAGLTLLQRSSALVRSLAGRRSAILLPTSPAFITALAASDGRGAVLVNPLAAPLEIAFQLRDADVGAVFTTEALAARLPEDVTRVLLDDAPRSAQVVAQGVVRTVDLGSHVGLSLIGDTTAAGRDEEAAIVYTSALQGRPAGAILTHRNLLANARATREALELDAADHALAVLPYAHLFGLVVSGIGPLLAGGRVTTMERFNPIRAAELLESEGITQIVGVPAVFAALLSAIERRGGRLASDALRLCVCGGAPLAVELQDRWAEATGVELRQGYGLTEAGPVCLFNRVSLPNRRGTLGVPFPGVDVEIHHATSRELLREREEGEIWVRGANVSPGYVNGAAGLDCHGDWLRTGDLGVRNADGTFSFTGLLKPMFTRNGFNIYPAELATAILELPSVRDVRVRPIPDPTRENDIAIDVWGDVTPDEVKRWCEVRLSVYKQPSEISVER